MNMSFFLYYVNVKKKLHIYIKYLIWIYSFFILSSTKSNLFFYNLPLDLYDDNSVLRIGSSLIQFQTHIYPLKLIENRPTKFEKKNNLKWTKLSEGLEGIICIRQEKVLRSEI